MVKIALRAGLAALVMAGLFGSSPAAPAKLASSAPAGDPVVARVEGTEIRQSDLETAWQGLPAQFHAMPKEQLMPAILDQLIDRRLAALAADKKGLAAKPEVARELAHAREDVLQSAYLRAYSELQITDAALKARYQEKLRAFKAQPEVHARHILTHDEKAIRAAADRLQKGEAFDKVAREVSVDGSAIDGGDLGFFTADKMVPEFSNVAFKLAAGQVSGPFQSRFGWHIVKVEEKSTTKMPPFADMQNELKSDMTNELVEKALAGLRKGAKIEKTPAALKAAPQPAH